MAPGHHRGGDGGGLARRLGTFGAHRPRLAIVIWLAYVVPLGIFGLGTTSRLHSTGVTVDGSPSGLMRTATNERFGDRGQLWVGLTGPAADVERTRVGLTRRLRDAGIELTGPAVKTEAGAQLLVAEVPGTREQLISGRATEARRLIKSAVDPPVHVAISGYEDIAAAITDVAKSDGRRFELLAIPLLLVVLLLVFRTPLAAMTPLIVGVGTTAAGLGVLRIINAIHPLDIFSANAMTMLGLALGVDYSLLIVSRFREERRDGKASPAAAAVATAATAGTTVQHAGLLIALALGISTVFAASDVLVGMGVASIIAATLSMFGALLVTPPILTLLGPHIDRWPVTRRPVPAPGSGRFAATIARRPRYSRAIVTAVLALTLAISAFALSVEPSALEPSNLPAGAAHRSDAEALDEAFGTRWSKPFQVLLTVDRGTVLDRDRLPEIAGWQDRLAREQRASVFGPGQLAPRIAKEGDPDALLATAKRVAGSGARDRRRLRAGLRQAQRGTAQLAEGLEQAAGAGDRLSAEIRSAGPALATLNAGLGEANAGSRRLAAAAAAADGGAATLEAGARAAAQGSSGLVDGLRQGTTGAGQLADGAQRLERALTSGNDDAEKLRDALAVAAERIDDAKTELDEAPEEVRASDQYRQGVAAVAEANATVARQRKLIDALIAHGERGASAAGSLRTDLTRLRMKLSDLHDDAGALVSSTASASGRASVLTDGLGPLAGGADGSAAGAGAALAGAARLTGAGDRLDASAVALGAQATEAWRSATPVHGALGDARAAAQGLPAPSAQLQRAVEDGGALRRASRSGFLPLAALEHAGPSTRAAAGAVVNIDRGGNAGLVSVLSAGDGPGLRDRLERSSQTLAHGIGARSQVGGWAAEIEDYTRLVKQRLPITIAVLSLVVWAVLAVMVRSLWLSTFAVLLNLLNTATTFGVLALAFGPHGLLGGNGKIDVLGLYLVFGTVFAFSIDYTLFLLSRMREGWELTGSTEQAVQYGVRTTAGVITGAAAVLIGVFLAFSTTQLLSLRQLGIGLATAILLDATIVRFVLLPAGIRALGDRTWGRA